MSQYAIPHTAPFESLIFNERERLVRLCSHIVGSNRAAEDLAQETLLVAWNKRNQITDPNGISYWLTAIARNVCRHWIRRQKREQKHLAGFDVDSLDEPSDNSVLSDDGISGGYASSANDPTQFTKTESMIGAVDEFNFELDLERVELATLLDKAMELLPLEMRALLIQHYIEEQPQAELATQAGLSKSALGVRLHRGKLALRRILTSELSNEAIAFGLIAPEVARWQETRIWCWNCGQHRLLGQLGSDQGLLRLRCPSCCGCSDGPEDDMVNADVDELQGLKAYKPAYSRLSKWIHSYYIEGAERGIVPCQYCGQRLKLRMGELPHLVGFGEAIHVWCNDCERGPGAESWGSLSQSLPEVMGFWKAHPRMKMLPVQTINFAGNPAVQLTYESHPDQARLEAIFSTDTFEVLHVG